MTAKDEAMPPGQPNIRALAVGVFGDPEKADRWLKTPLSILNSRTPLDVARSETGALFVARMLAKIDWGAAA